MIQTIVQSFKTTDDDIQKADGLVNVFLGAGWILSRHEILPDSTSKRIHRLLVFYNDQLPELNTIRQQQPEVTQ